MKNKKKIGVDLSTKPEEVKINNDLLNQDKQEENLTSKTTQKQKINLLI